MDVRLFVQLSHAANMSSIVYISLLVFHIFQVESVTICETICECRENNSIITKCTFEYINTNLTLPNNAITLDLSEKNLTIIETSILFDSNSLQELYLNNNGIKEINPNSFQLPKLKTLDLSYNLLEKIDPDLFKGVPKLENLILADNKFTITSQLNLSYLVNLQQLTLDNNFLGPDIILRPLFNTSGYGLPLSLKSLSLSRINLTDLPENYFDPVEKSLKVLIVSNNGLTKVFKLPKNIQYLDLSSNPIKHLSLSDFPYDDPLIYLRVLKLNNLLIEKIQRNLFAALMLTDLELTNNRNLKEFSNLTFGRQILSDSYDFNIQNLSLSGSNLSTLDEGLSVLFQRVERLDLQDNPWVCDCELTWMRLLNITPNLTENLRCTYPRHLHNMKLFDLQPSDFKCPRYQAGWIAYETGITLGALLYCILVVVTLLWIYKYVHRPAASGNRQGYTQLH